MSHHFFSTNQNARKVQAENKMALYASKGYATPGGGGDGMGSFEEADNLSAYYNDDVRGTDELRAMDEGLDVAWWLRRSRVRG